MEFAVIWLISLIAVGEQVNDSSQRVEALESQVQLQQKWIEDLENWNTDQDNIHERDFLTIAGELSIDHANQELVNRQQDSLNENMTDRIDYLDEKIKILHP